MCIPKGQGGMGFRELNTFIDCLLAKNQDSLFYKVLKSKYFPNGSFFDAPDHHNGSYAWQSILGARHIIQRGTRWRIGNCEKAKIWQSKWMPTPHTYLPVSPIRTVPPDLTVGHLIDIETGQWNGYLIDDIFLAHEAEIIKTFF